MGNDKYKKPKTSDASKIHLLESDVLGNAKSTSVLKICYLPEKKCFFSKMPNWPVKITKKDKIDT